MNNIKFIIISAIIISAGLYLFWPLTSTKWLMEFDLKSLHAKSTFLSKSGSIKDTTTPNILLIVVDDLGMADLSLYKNGSPKTPNIDALGAESIIFNNAYVTSPVCSPSRAAILTGRYQQRFGFEFQLHDRYLKNRMEYLAFKYFIDSYPWIPKWMDEVPDKKSIDLQGLPPSEILLPELLKTRGYHTALIGKWHLGSDEAQLPCNLGFDYQYGFYASHSLYAYEKTSGIHDQKVDGDFTDAHIWSGQRNGPHAIYKNCEEMEVSEYLTDRFTDEAIEYLNRADTSPFFLYLSYNAPHTPLQAPDSYMKQFAHIKDPVKRTYMAMIKNLDDNIGRLLGVLNKNGLDDNTIIFFISDNGGAEYTHTTENGKYKGGKITDFEGGLKVPFIMKWKNKLQPGYFDPMVSSMDIFHTIAENADLDLPKDRIYDGVNLIPYILGEIDDAPHEYLYWQRGFSKTIRSKEWKLFLNEDMLDTALFDIKSDPFETNEVAVLHPEIVNQFVNEHQRWSSSLPPAMWPSMIFYEYKDGEKIYYFDQ